MIAAPPFLLIPLHHLHVVIYLHLRTSAPLRERSFSPPEQIFTATYLCAPNDYYTIIVTFIIIIIFSRS
jgi:hypothetical protein